jgi:hypothetical protein
MPEVTTRVRTSDKPLEARLSDELSKYNASATPDVASAKELNVRAEEGADLIGGMSGWTWGCAAGIAMAWM